MEDFAPTIFDSGCRDPYMLFDHMVRDDWGNMVPAICHIDGTARVQTVSAEDNPVIHRLLAEYNELTGVPLLCNTSANHNSSGFFPDVASATAWGGVRFVWSADTLYTRVDS